MIRFRRANRNLGEQGFTPEQKSLPEPPAGRTLDAGIMFQLMLNGPAKTVPLVWRQAAPGHLRPARFVFHPYPARFRINSPTSYFRLHAIEPRAAGLLARRIPKFCRLKAAPVRS